ncbi:cadherin-8 isoform X2 [Panthera pardus]|uniref:Cadherin-8 isoform X2 n=1 Tax=Panthera pardus TaxID=9691 RepID=A0A9V1FY35_PANPR|nr:cadherin-8 isoform X2 [Panthera pardus]XP_023100761.1 cadherin-8 isoform X2 [Felis catus]XP_045298923.1 cadherin-8 isoform X2 [Leopardus geoffroyi]XP_058562084.1 cadherin-8 isoform X2 [Neofelis nebulosa]XP_060506596.1 cadherin-8 isoform X2 [Panthera onca]
MPERLAEMLLDLWTPLIILWITLPPCIYTAPMNQSQVVMSGSPLELSRLSEQRILNRSKRGWVWNQMFVLEEFSGPEPILVGRLHTDLDPGSKKIKYILSGDGAGTIFQINDITGDIHAIKRLDREEKAEYTLTAQAVDWETNKPLEPPSEFIIKVQDINDNAPEFLNGPYHATVPEMSILAIIKTALPNMDREAKEEYLVVIQAKDMGGHSGGLSGTTTLTVTLTDVNDNPPKFAQSLYHFSVPEDVVLGTAIGRVKANDQDIGENAQSSYDIIDGDGTALFEITSDAQAQDGIIRLRKPLDFETKKSYTLKVEAANVHIDPRFSGRGPFKDTATVKIVVEDADEPPVFSSPTYLLEVHENAALNSVIGQVTARDPDITSSPIRFSIDRHTDLERQFNINADDGKITLATPLDRELSVWHNITIIATEIRNHSQISRVPVAIKVLDVNDNAPEFASEYEAFLCENGKPGQSFLSGKHVIKLEMIELQEHTSNPLGRKEAEELKGNEAILLKRPLNIGPVPPETGNIYQELKRSQLGINQVLSEENGNLAGRVEEQVIQTVSAMDKDDPKNGHYFLYSLLPEMVNNPNFTIKKNEDNSLSILAKHNGFNRQKQEVYLLPIIISDSGNPPLSSTSTLTIRVCGCSSDGVVQSCNVEAYVLPIGLSMGALIAILACIILLLVIVVLFVTLRRHKNEPLIIKDDEDVRENIIRYDDEGGGEEDTEAFDIATLQNPDGINGFLPRKDIKPDLQFMPRQGLAPVPNGVDVDEFINVRLHEADNDPTAPPYDSIQIYGYEGRGSVAGSLSSLESSTSDSDQNFDYLSDWGPRFKRLGELYSVGESDKET